ncbi:PREDICTED: pancreatic triacylglycerol lipase-like [Ceratosolen solmsi marchali]|uniref:phospholipase A1 n=1 Tax=Ceratosolen solmsi marchali TaxID=326594 RepID=A0AAJ6YLK8_9HYME|nr:PREDICTED: pancreatic triacylglycerol lipase-like [Ceratosolen solmsi marchali]
MIVFSFISNITADVPTRQQFENLPDFLLEEVILDSYINSLSTLPEDFLFLTNVLDPIMVPERDISFSLFTRKNPSEPLMLKLDDIISLRNSNFITLGITKIIIHGWTDNGNSSWIQDIRRNYLLMGNYNIIVVDWSAGSLKEYLVSASLTKQVGDYVSQFMGFLLMEGVLSLDNIHVLGHSLGAHIAGAIGRNLSGKMARITGMDPARPDFEAPVLKDLNDRLDLTDAKFVDVIHTCAGTAGFIRPIGHVDFYPNGGSFRQPGCPVLLTQYCSHARSHQYMGESIINPAGFPALECNGWMEFKSGKCDKNKNQIIYMGEKLEMNTRGIYFLETNVESPYGRSEL